MARSNWYKKPDLPQSTPQTGYPGPKHEENLAGSETNTDARHLEAALYQLVDEPISLETVLELTAEATGASIERIAEVVDHLVSTRRWAFAAGKVAKHRLSDLYTEFEYARVAQTGDEMEPLYREWMEIYNRHPEWKIKLTESDDPAVIDLSQPHETMKGLSERIQYDESAVRPEDQQEFQRFLELDRLINEWESKGGPEGGMPKTQSLRAIALFKMLGGRTDGFGLVRRANSFRIVRMAAAAVEEEVKPGRGDAIHHLGNELAKERHGSDIATLPWDKQLKLLNEAEQMIDDEYPLGLHHKSADMGIACWYCDGSGYVDDQGDPVVPEPEELVPGKKVYRCRDEKCQSLHRCWRCPECGTQKQADMGMGGDDQPPPPDEKAPEGYEKFTDEMGKSHWRPKNQPGSQVKIERPQA